MVLLRGQILIHICPKFLELLKMCNGQGKAVRIATVEVAKVTSWWEEAYSYGVGENAWYFGVDGIDEKSELYLIGPKFSKMYGVS